MSWPAVIPVTSAVAGDDSDGVGGPPRWLDSKKWWLGGVTLSSGREKPSFSGVLSLRVQNEVGRFEPLMRF